MRGNRIGTDAGQALCWAVLRTERDRRLAAAAGRPITTANLRRVLSRRLAAIGSGTTTGRLDTHIGRQAGKSDHASDVEFERDPVTADRREEEEHATTARPFILFRGKSDVAVKDDPAEIRPGDTVVLPAPPTFPTALGTPGTDPARVDVHDEARRVARAERTWRVRPGGPYDKDTTDLAAAEQEDSDREALLSALDVPQGQRCRAIVQRYPDGKGRIVLVPGEGELEESDPYEFDELDLLDVPREAEHTLVRHTQRVAARAREFATRCLGPDLIPAVVRAAELHDVGKADERFQRCLNNGRRFDVGEPLAKSRATISRQRWQQLQALSSLPAQFRHEMLSVQLAAASHAADEPDRDLVLHLIASHHGHARPFAPVCMDESPPDVSFDGMRLGAGARNDPPPHRLDSGVCDRFWKLTRQYGWWELAYLEAMLRLADQRASREAEEC